MGENGEYELEENEEELEVPWYQKLDAQPKTSIPAWLDKVEWTEPEGTVKIATYDWLKWDMVQKGEIAGRVSDEEPDKYEEWSYERMADSTQGWKLHLSFDQENTTKVDEIASALIAMRQKGLISLFKIGAYNGKSNNQPGKEATVYVGHRDKAALVAGLIERGLGSVLSPPGEKAIEDDIPFSEHIMGRFEVTTAAQDFDDYGAKGHQLLRRDVAAIYDLEERKRQPDEIERARAPMIERASSILRERFGEFYTGRQAA